jgi:hypothetical protein
MTVMIFCCINLIRALKKSRSIRSSKVRKQGDNLTVRIVAVVIVFIILEFPPILMNIVYAAVKVRFEFAKETLIEALEACYSLGCINSSINFYLYVLTGKNFRRTAIRLVSCDRRLPRTDSARTMTENVPQKGVQRLVIGRNSRIIKDGIDEHEKAYSGADV